MSKTIVTRLVEELGAKSEWTKGIQIELHPDILYCRYHFCNKGLRELKLPYNDERILKELKVLLFIIRWQDKRGAYYRLPNLFKRYLDKYGFVELYKIYKEEKMMTTGNDREEIELFEKEWNYLIEKIKTENNIEF